MIYPAKLDMTILQGATFHKEITWKSGDGTPFDLTGAEVRMQARYAPQANEVLVEASTANGMIVIDDAVGGKFSILLPATETNTFTFSSAVYDLEVEMPDGTVYRPLEGKLRVELQVTR